MVQQWFEPTCDIRGFYHVIVSVVPHRNISAVDLLISRAFCVRKAILYDITEKGAYSSTNGHVDEPLEKIHLL